MNEEILLMLSSLEERVEALTEDKKETKEIKIKTFRSYYLGSPQEVLKLDGKYKIHKILIALQAEGYYYNFFNFRIEVDGKVLMNMETDREFARMLPRISVPEDSSYSSNTLSMGIIEIKRCIDVKYNFSIKVHAKNTLEGGRLPMIAGNIMYELKK